MKVMKVMMKVVMKVVMKVMKVVMKVVMKEVMKVVIDSGTPVSLVSSAWFQNYLKEAKVDNEEVQKSSSNCQFRLGKTPYVSIEKVKFPVVMKTDNNDFIKRDITANIIESNEVNFLCGEETLMKWKTVLDFADRKLGFKEKNKAVDLIKGSHLLVKLELVGKWRDEDAVFLVQEEDDLKTLKAVMRIHKVLNHKKKEDGEGRGEKE